MERILLQFNGDPRHGLSNWQVKAYADGDIRGEKTVSYNGQPTVMRLPDNNAEMVLKLYNAVLATSFIEHTSGLPPHTDLFIEIKSRPPGGFVIKNFWENNDYQQLRELIEMIIGESKHGTTRLGGSIFQ